MVAAAVPAAAAAMKLTLEGGEGVEAPGGSIATGRQRECEGGRQRRGSSRRANGCFVQQGGLGLTVRRRLKRRRNDKEGRR